MNAKKLITITNMVAIFSVLILLYWVFITIISGVFDLKVFQGNITNLFFSSLGGILAILFGALVLNIMLNLTRIAEKHNADRVVDEKSVSPNAKLINRVILIVFLASFPLITLLLFGGDHLSAMKKERILIDSATLIVKENGDMMAEITDYSFDWEWINNTTESLIFLSKLDRNYQGVTVIVQDRINEKNVFLEFSRNDYVTYDEASEEKGIRSVDKGIKKLDYVFRSDMNESLYLNGVFAVLDGEPKKRFSSNGGNYELFYPISVDGKWVVLLFRDRQVYGKIGSK